MKLVLNASTRVCIRGQLKQARLPPRVPVLETVAFPEAPEVRFRTSYIQPGTPISSNDRQIDYLGCYLTVMPQFDAALRRSRELRAAIRVNGSEPGVF